MSTTKNLFNSIEQLEEQLLNFKQMGGYVINPIGNTAIDLEVGQVVELPTTGKFQLIKGFDRNGKPFAIKQFAVLYSAKEYFITVPESYNFSETLQCKVSTYTSKSGKEVKTFEFLPTTSTVGKEAKKANLIEEKVADK